MFSNLGPLFKATFRQTEQADTRMAIRKDDPRDPGKRHAPDTGGDDSDDLWEDTTGVSIEALRVFLRDFVAGRTGAAAAGGPGAVPAPGGAVSPPPAGESRNSDEIHPPAAPLAAKAARAYQAQAGHTAPPSQPPPATASSDVDLVDTEDVRLIHVLIADLDRLAQAGVEILVLEKSDSFLHSLQDAVSKARSNI